MTTFFRYSGSKFKYIKLINKYVKTDKRTYIEPFIGSGAILFNLDKEFDRYIINDLDRNIVRIYKTFKEINYSDYLNVIQKISIEFGDIKKSKESYYNFRNWFNKYHWHNDTTDEGIYLHILANSCINSMFRFGPNGMNQSFGNRFYELDEIMFNSVKSKLKRTEIYNRNYKDIMNEDGFFFLDPPYFSQASSYSGFTETDFLEFLDIIKDKEYLYTDIINSYNEIIDNKLIIKEMNSTAPSSNKSKNGNIECLFSSYELVTTSKFNW